MPGTAWFSKNLARRFTVTPILLGFLLLEIVLLLVLRPFLLWYLKVNRAVEALESIAESLEQMPAAKQYRSSLNQPRRKVI
jgi:hypothetical protein